MTAVIYARYSSDNQREESIEGPIAEGSQGILGEILLEGMAEYYSAELSEKVIRGQTENALKGKCTGARAATKKPCRKNGWKIWSSGRP